jgi:hypothetical protein
VPVTRKTIAHPQPHVMTLAATAVIMCRSIWHAAQAVMTALQWWAALLVPRVSPVAFEWQWVSWAMPGLRKAMQAWQLCFAMTARLPTPIHVIAFQPLIAWQPDPNLQREALE